MKKFYEVPMGNIKDEILLQKEVIRSLVEYERYCTDYGLKEQRKTLWFEDGIIITTWFKGPVLDYFNASPVKGGKVRDKKESHGHKVNNTVVWMNPEGDRAVAELMCKLIFRTELGTDWVDIQCDCRMHYRLEKRKERWGILYFEGIYEKDRLDPVFQDRKLNLPRIILEQYRSCNWNMALRRDLFEGGLENQDNWAGMDRPETIERLYKKTSEWFYKEG